MTVALLTWDDVRNVSAHTLAVGEMFIQPNTGTAYFTDAEGRCAGVGWMPLDGVEWTVTVREGDAITCRAADGREITTTVKASARVLRAVDPALVGGA